MHAAEEAATKREHDLTEHIDRMGERFDKQVELVKVEVVKRKRRCYQQQ